MTFVYGVVEGVPFLLLMYPTGLYACVQKLDWICTCSKKICQQGLLFVQLQAEDIHRLHVQICVYSWWITLSFYFYKEAKENPFVRANEASIPPALYYIVRNSGCC